MVSAVGDSTYLLSGTVGGGEILVYEGSGGAIRIMGSEGEGPGELGDRLRLISSQDTLFVLDDGNVRMTMLGLEGGVVGSFRLPSTSHAVVRLPDGRFLLHRRPSTLSAPLFRVIDLEGNEVGSFHTSTFPESLYDTDQWVLGEGQTADFWAAGMWEYEFYRGTPDSVTLAVVRETDWFPRGARWTEGLAASEPPPHQAMYVREDPRGLLWIGALVPDTEWAPDLPDPGSASWYRDTFDSVLEVLDLSTGQVLASARSDYWLGRICGSDLLYAVAPTELGDTRVQIFRPALSGWQP